MRIETIKKLCCPFDKSDLMLRPITIDEQNHILEGILICHTCKRVYPIISGIPIMNPDEYRDFNIEQLTLESWNKFLNSLSNEPLKIVDGKIIEPPKGDQG
ncbi:MAG: hypothetical protein K6T34_08650 [Thermoflavifilum sp.]|nr:hypothetical protein [Thermoflavifilum sp.]